MRKRSTHRNLLHGCFLKGGAPPSMNSNGEGADEINQSEHALVRNLGRASLRAPSDASRLFLLPTSWTP